MKKSLIIAACLALSASPLYAHEANELLVRVGAVKINPNASSGSVLGGGVDVDSATGLGFSGTWFYSSHWGVELLAALPFKHDIKGTGGLNGLDIGSTKHLPPTLSLQYYPLGEGNFTPYIGLGLNYTTFFSEKTSSSLDAALAGNTDLSLDSSTGLAYQLGADWKIGENLYVNAALWKMNIDTRAHISVDGAQAAAVDVTIDPWVAMMGLGFSF